jgi:acetylornithine deacetylase
MTEKKIFNIIDKNKETYIKRLKKLINLYPEGEKKLQNHIASRFKEVGCKVKTIQLYPSTVQLNKEFASEEVIDRIKRIHVIGKKPGSSKGNSLMLIAHPDADPINPEGWTVPLHEGKIINGKIFGWGAADDLSGISIMTEALDALNEAGFSPDGDVFLVSASAKRNAYGIAAILREGYSADAAVYLHPAESELGLKEIKSITSGLLKFRIRLKGMRPPKTEFVQATFSNLGVNPIEKAIYIIEAFGRLNEHRIRNIRYEPLNKEIGRGTNILVSYIKAGKKDNLTDIPKECIIGFGLTFPPDEDIDELVEEIEEYLEKITDADPWLKDNPPELEWVQGTQGTEIPVDHPLVKTTVDAFKIVTGNKPISNPLYSKSDLRTPMLINNIPMIGFGPQAGGLSTTGGVNEWVGIDEYIDAIKICAKMITQWCK